MRVVFQRSLESSVLVNNEEVGKINKGLVLLVGFHVNDSLDKIDYMIKKILKLRIFDDDNGVMNKSIIDIKGEILSISQFTLYADTTNGNRPSYINAMKSKEAKKLYNIFNNKLRESIKVETGIFGSDMKLNITNDGPVTIILER